MIPATRLYDNGRTTTPFEATVSDLICKCGKPVTYSNESRCEDCYADDAERISRHSPHVDINFHSAKEEAVIKQRSDQVIGWFKNARK